MRLAPLSQLGGGAQGELYVQSSLPQLGNEAREQYAFSP